MTREEAYIGGQKLQTYKVWQLCSPMHDNIVHSEGNLISFKDLCTEDGDKNSDPESSIDPSIPIPDHETN